jgi:hypothetical protein
VVGHGVVLKRKLAVVEHELGVVLLPPSHSPGRVHHYHLETELPGQSLEVEVAHVPVHEALALYAHYWRLALGVPLKQILEDVLAADYIFLYLLPLHLGPYLLFLQLWSRLGHGWLRK